jgi:ribosomal protein S18 acetylase RimI-like enzyme
MIFSPLKSKYPQQVAAFYQAYKAAFPAHERRSFAQIQALLLNPSAQILGLKQAQKWVAYLVVWPLRDALFLEHLLVLPQFQNQGFGQKIMQKLKQIRPNLVLECEPKTDDWASQARLRFYERLGFSIINTPYQQPPYQAGQPWVDLHLMANFEVKSPQFLVEDIYSKVYARP